MNIIFEPIPDFSKKFRETNAVFAKEELESWCDEKFREINSLKMKKTKKFALT